jgi:hypothetical protein
VYLSLWWVSRIGIIESKDVDIYNVGPCPGKWFSTSPYRLTKWVGTYFLVFLTLLVGHYCSLQSLLIRLGETWILFQFVFLIIISGVEQIFTHSMFGTSRRLGEAGRPILTLERLSDSLHEWFGWLHLSNPGLNHLCNVLLHSCFVHVSLCHWGQCQLISPDITYLSTSRHSPLCVNATSEWIIHTQFRWQGQPKFQSPASPLISWGATGRWLNLSGLHFPWL